MHCNRTFRNPRFRVCVAERKRNGSGEITGVATSKAKQKPMELYPEIREKWVIYRNRERNGVGRQITFKH